MKISEIADIALKKYNLFIDFVNLIVRFSILEIQKQIQVPEFSIF